MDQIAVYGVFRDAGIEEEKAKAIASTLRREFEQSVDSKELATKADLKIEIEKMRGEIEKAKFSIIGAMVAIAGISLAVAKFLLT